MRRIFKFLKFTLIVCLLETLVFSSFLLYSPHFASAVTTKALVDRTPSVSSDYESDTKELSNLIIKGDDLPLQAEQRFRLILPDGVKWITDKYTGDSSVISDIYLEVQVVSEKVLELNTKEANGNSTDLPAQTIPLWVKMDGVESGPIDLTLDSMDSSISGGRFQIGSVISGETVTTVGAVKSVASGETFDIDTIRIDESATGALYDTDNESWQRITLTLPPDFSWYNDGGSDTADHKAAKIYLGGAFSDKAQIAKNRAGEGAISERSADLYEFIESANKRALTFFFKSNVKDARGTIYFQNVRINSEESESNGDIILSVEGDKVTSEDVKVAEIADYGAEVSISEVKEFIPGKYDSSWKTGRIVIKETVGNSFVGGRDLKIILPESRAKVFARSGEQAKIDFSGSDLVGTINKDRNEITIPIPANRTKDRYQIKMVIPLQVVGSGDIEATIKGAGISEEKLVIGKTVPTMKVETQMTNVKIGVRDQSAADIIVSELAAGAFWNEKYKNVMDQNWIEFYFEKGISISETPTVEVIEGDLQIDSDSVQLLTDKGGSENNAIKFTIRSKSTKPSKIKISGIKVSIDRTVPYGKVPFIFSTLALTDYQTVLDFNINSKWGPDYLNVITPAANEVSMQSFFQIGSSKYRLGGDEKEMDVVPYIKDGRTYLPVRYASEALGINENNVIWDPGKKTITIFKRDSVIQMAIGSKVLLLNGIKFPMDVAPEMKDGRTMLPVHYIAVALGAKISWDEQTKIVAIENK